jgi:hypothetical protein
MVVRSEDWSTVEDRREAVTDLLDSQLASMRLPHPAAAAAAAKGAAAGGAAAAGRAECVVPTVQAAASATAPTATGAPAAASTQQAGCSSKWLAAEDSLQEAVQDLMQQQGRQDPALRRGVQCTARVVNKLALRDHLGVQARDFLAHMEVRHRAPWDPVTA